MPAKKPRKRTSTKKKAPAKKPTPVAAKPPVKKVAKPDGPNMARLKEEKVTIQGIIKGLISQKTGIERLRDLAVIYRNRAAVLEEDAQAISLAVDRK